MDNFSPKVLEMQKEPVKVWDIQKQFPSQYLPICVDSLSQAQIMDSGQGKIPSLLDFTV